MGIESSQPRAAGLLFIRALLGIILFMQGFGKVFSMGVPQVYDKFFQPFESTWLPHWVIMVTAYYTSYVELIGGALLLIGLFRKYALYLIAIDLCVVAFGHGMMQPIWDLQHVMPRAILVAALLLLPQQWDRWNVDMFLTKRGEG